MANVGSTELAHGASFANRTHDSPHSVDRNAGCLRIAFRSGRRAARARKKKHDTDRLNPCRACKAPTTQPPLSVSYAIGHFL